MNARRILPLACLAASAVSAAPQAQSGCGSAPVWQTYGAGTAGAAGVPRIELVGLPVIGGPVGLVVKQGPPSGAGLLFYSAASSALPLPSFGATLYPAAPFQSAGFALGTSGDSAPVLSLPTIPAKLCGVDLHLQAAVVDGSAQGGVSFSAGRQLGFGEHSGPVYAQGAQIATGWSPLDVALADLDHDGRDDLLVMNAGSDELSVHKALGGG